VNKVITADYCKPIHNKIQSKLKDYLIIGQGLAGILMTNELRAHNLSFTAVADTNKISATSVAAGMFNPLIFRRITKSWMVDDLLPVMYSTFSDIEKWLDTQLIYRKPIVKLITESEYESWVTKNKNLEINKYIQKLTKGNSIEGVINYFGSATIANSGYVDLGRLLNVYHQKLIDEESLLYANFRYNDLEIKDTHVQWNGLRFKNVIFCEGAFAVNNPLFKEVKYKLTKGDVLTLSIDNFKLDYIVNKMAFVLEKSKGVFLCGSTYNWSGLDFSCDKKDEQYLKEKISLILDKPFDVVEHQIAVRPTVIDRRPVLGTHATYKNVHYFNGLGTKGVMLGPYFAKHMFEFLQKNIPLNPEVNINRFF